MWFSSTGSGFDSPYRKSFFHTLFFLYFHFSKIQNLSIKILIHEHILVSQPPQIMWNLNAIFQSLFLLWNSKIPKNWWDFRKQTIKCRQHGLLTEWSCSDLQRLFLFITYDMNVCILKSDVLTSFHCQKERTVCLKLH